MKINWSPLSIERILEIAEYIAKDKLGASNNWIELIFKSGAGNYHISFRENERWKLQVFLGNQFFSKWSVPV